MKKFTDTPNSVIDDTSISRGAKAIYTALLSFGQDQVSPDQARLAEMTGSPSGGKMNKGFTQTPNSVMFDPSISRGAKAVYTALLRFGQDQVSPDQTRLAEKAGYSKSTVKKCLNELREKKLISWKRLEFNETNVYTIHPVGEK